MKRLVKSIRSVEQALGSGRKEPVKLRIVRHDTDSDLAILKVEEDIHDVPVLPMIDRGYIIENGMLVLTGTGTDLMDNPEVRSAYFGV